MRNFLLVACLLVLKATVPLHAAEEQVFTFGASLPLTGEFEPRGKKALAGIKLRVDDHNANLKPGQHRLKYIVRDDKSDPVVAQKNIQYFADKKIQAVVGPLASAFVPGMREVAEKEHVAIISPCVTSPKAGKDKDWVCRLFFDDEFQGTALARYLYEKKNIRQAAAIINDRLPFSYPVSVFTAFKKELERLGGKIVAVQRYKWVANEDDNYDFSLALRNVQKAMPQIVLLPASSVEVAAIVSQAAKMDLALTFCGGDTWTNELIPMASGRGIENALFITGFNFDSDSPAMQHYRCLYEQSHDPDLQLSSVMGYDAVSLLIEALKYATDAESIRECLYKIRKLNLAVGTVTIDPERGSEKTAYIHQFIKKGTEFVPVLVDEVVP